MPPRMLSDEELGAMREMESIFKDMRGEVFSPIAAENFIDIIGRLLDHIEALSSELERLKRLEWLAMDCVWSLPTHPKHPTFERLITFFEGDDGAALRQEDAE